MLEWFSCSHKNRSVYPPRSCRKCEGSPTNKQSSTWDVDKKSVRTHLIQYFSMQCSIQEEQQTNAIYEYVRVVFSVGIACLCLTFGFDTWVFAYIDLYFLRPSIAVDCLCLLVVSISYRLEDGHFRNSSCRSFANFNKDDLFWTNILLEMTYCIGKNFRERNN